MTHCLSLDMPGGGMMKDMVQGMAEKFDNFTCGRVDLMGEIVTRKQFHEYIFLIIYSTFKG